MRVDQIKDEYVRGVISGSCIPANELLYGYMGREPVTGAAKAEAEAYFAFAGGLRAAAERELAFERANDC
jgi:hypothetical protein